MIQFRCRFGIRLPFFANLGIIVFYAPATITAQISEGITGLRLWSAGTKYEESVKKIVWEANQA